MATHNLLTHNTCVIKCVCVSQHAEGMLTTLKGCCVSKMFTCSCHFGGGADDESQWPTRHNRSYVEASRGGPLLGAQSGHVRCAAALPNKRSKVIPLAPQEMALISPSSGQRWSSSARSQPTSKGSWSIPVQRRNRSASAHHRPNMSHLVDHGMNLDAACRTRPHFDPTIGRFWAKLGRHTSKLGLREADPKASAVEL